MSVSGGSAKDTSWFPSDADAIRAAREEVKQMFRSSEQLGRIQPYLLECTRKKAAVESQLSSAVRTQVDETRLGLQLLSEASVMMSNMRAHFQAIDAYCKDCKTVLRDSPDIARVNTARKNLDATTRLLDKFRSLPEQAEAILEELYSNDHSIKAVYKSLRKLFHLRDSAMDQQSGGGASGAPGGGSGFSSDFLAQLQENFAELSRSAGEIEERVWENIADCMFLARDDPVTLVRTLEVVELEERAMRKVFGQKQPEEKEAVTKEGKEDTKKTPAKKNAAPVDQSSSAPMISMREKCLNTLEKSIADLFNHLHIDEEQSIEAEKKAARDKILKAKKYEEWKKKQPGYVAPGAGDDVDEPLELIPSSPPGSNGGLFHDADEPDEPQSSVDRNAPSDFILKILETMTDLTENLPGQLATLAPCFPPEYNIVPFFVERYLRWMKLTLSFHTNEPSKLSKKALLKTVNWIEWYRTQLQGWEQKFPGCRDTISASDLAAMDTVTLEKRRKEMSKKADAERKYFDDLVRDLMHCYTQSTEETLIKLCDNILNSEKRAEAELDGSGYYVTSGPPDLFYTINSTTEIVLQNFGLNARPLSFVCLMLAKIFEHYQTRQLEFLNEVKLDDDQLYFGEESILKTDTYFCAIINNSTICVEHMDDLKDKICDRLRQAEGIEHAAPLLQNGAPGGPVPASLLDQMENVFEECGEGFVSVASEAIDLLVLQISATLQKPISNLFTPSWLKDSSVTDDIVLTLQDFMTDYKKWIGRDAYFSRILIKCLHSVIQEYLRTLTERKPNVSAQLFERLKADKAILQQFFMQYTSEESGALIPLQLLKNELRLLTLVNKVVHEDVEFMSVHFDKIITRFGHSARDVMEGLLAMRTDLSKAQRKEQMDKFIAKLPAADPAALLQQQLVQQNVAAMSSPKATPDKRKQGKADETSTKSFWDVFKSREKKDKGKGPVAKKKRAGDDEGVSLQDFTDR